MKKFDGILFCTDLDGTLLRSDNTISKENLDAIECFKSEGGSFTFITGRVPLISRDICNVIRPNVPFGCINGGGIYDPCTEQYLWTVSLPEQVMELVEYVDKALPDVGIQLNTQQQVYFNKYNSAMVKFREVTKLPLVACHYRDVKEPVVKVVFAHEDEERICELERLLNNHSSAVNYDFVRSEQTLYEIIPKGINKGTALTKLVQLLDMDIERTIAVGDFENDITMIRNAKIGYAVANARPTVKNVADRITVGNDEHAIAKIIDELNQSIIRL